MGTRSHQHLLVGGDGKHAALDVDPVEGRGGAQEPGQEREGAARRQLAHTASSSMCTSEMVDSFRSPAGDHEADKTRRTLEGHPSRLRSEGLGTTATTGSHTLPTWLSVLIGTGATAATH